jgi:hypothetical protein
VTRESSYWFPAKRYGWGWGPPIAWQGWTVLALWLIAIFASAVVFLPKRMIAFQVSILLLTVALVLVCYKTGEPPSWRWGDRK